MRFALLAILLTGCATGPGGDDLQVGTYGFEASWVVTGFSDPATAAGQLTVSAITTGSATWTFQLDETRGPVVKTGTATYDEVNGWVFITGTIGRAGSWFLLPHFDAGRCWGNAFNVGEGRGRPMVSCTWTRR